ncbi:transposase, partial [Luteococcus sanguinis]
YGVGITAALRRNGIQVVEVNRTRPAERRKQGKTDRLDAYRAARSVISGEATTHPKRDTIESLRALVVTRRSANKSSRPAGARSAPSWSTPAPGCVTSTVIWAVTSSSTCWPPLARTRSTTWPTPPPCEPCAA